MGYDIGVGETRPLLDQDDAPLATAGVTDPSGFPPPFTTGIASIHDDGAGHLVCVGIAAGTQVFQLKKSGTLASHTVTVTATVAPFDWSLGDPI